MIPLAGLFGSTVPPLPAEVRIKLEQLLALLEKWNPRINLVAPSTIQSAWSRHVEDSLQIFDLLPPGARRWCDLGSGAGFPGMVVAILAAHSHPELNVVLVEADQRKATFLQTVSRETSTPISLIADRIEAIAPLQADVISARALAPLPDLCGYAARHLAVGGTALFLKGAKALAEIEAARRTWRFDLQSHPSRTDPSAVILEMKEIAHG